MLVPRPQLYDTYWRFAAQRQDIFFKRLAQLTPPWSDDEILNVYKFCNTYRASDRVSQYLIRHVIYSGAYSDEDTIFRIVLFKLFNKIETWQWLESRLGELTLASFDFIVYADTLQAALDAGQAIYTSAYMSCANKAFGFEKKHQNHLMLLVQMFQVDRLASSILRAPSLEAVFRLLLAYPLIGNFMAYQLAIDLNYSAAIDFSENSFTVAGPGAERGIQKCFVSIGDKSSAYIIQWMQEHQEREFERLGLSFRSLWGRPLHLIDCQGLFCETDKYARAAFPELKSNRIRIKTRYQPTPGRIDYAYPPKWGINATIPFS